MKKDVILEALKNAGVELEEDKLKEFITAINIANDSDIQKVKKDRESLEEKLKEYENTIKTKDDELSKFDKNEIEALRQYKTDNENKIKSDIQTEAIKMFLNENKYSHDDILLSYIKSNLVPSFDDENKITNGDAILANLNDKASQYKITETTGGAEATKTNGNASNGDDLNTMDYESYKAWRKEHNN